MMDKKPITLALLVLLAGALHAQTLEEGHQQLYYERYQSAQNTFRQIVSRQPENGEAWLGLVNASLARQMDAQAAEALAAAPASAAG